MVVIHMNFKQNLANPSEVFFGEYHKMNLTRVDTEK